MVVSKYTMVDFISYQELRSIYLTYTFSVPLLLPLLSSKRAKGGPRELQANKPHLSPWLGDGKVVLEVISRHMKDKKEIRSSQHERTKTGHT